MGTAVLVAAAVPALAGTLSVDATPVPGRGSKPPTVAHTLRFTGPVDVSDAEKLRAELTKIRAKASPGGEGPLATLELSGKGGDLLEGIKIGYLLREFEVATVVRKDDVCLSACAIAFLGGTRSRQLPAPIPSRSVAVGARVGFQNFSINVDQVKSETRGDAAAGIARSFSLARAGAAQMMRFVTDMGVAPAFIAGLIGLSPDQLHYIETVGDFLETGSCPVGNLPKPGRPEIQAVNVCRNAVGMAGVAEPSQAQRMSASQAQRHLLEHVRSNIVGLNVKGPLAAQLAAVVANSDNRLIESVYADLRAGGVSLPDMKGTHFEVTLGMGELGPTQCHITLSPDEPDSFDLTLITQNGFMRPFILPPQGCARLFRYDREDIINPAN